MGGRTTVRFAVAVIDPSDGNGLYRWVLVRTLANMLRKICSTALCIVLGGCSYSSARFSSGLVERLKNRGPVTLSPNNPFLATNLLLAQESERSLELHGFLRKRGVPGALEVRKEFWAPVELILYYPKSQERYVLEDTGASWAIRGPEYLSAEMAGELEQRRKGDMNVLVLGEQPARANRFEMRDEPLLLGEGESVPSLDMVERPGDPSAPRTRPRKPPPPGDLPHTTKKTFEDSFDGMSLESGDLAEITPRGDLVHYVTFDGEDLSAITRWYTGDPANTEKILRINRLAGSGRVSIGDSIVIPSYLVRRKSRLTESALRALQVLQREERKGGG